MLPRQLLSIQRRSSSVVTHRHFWSVSGAPSPSTFPGGVFVTKYKIVKPQNEGEVYDDLLLSLPDQADLAKENKEVPLFLRYLRLVAEKENRIDDFREFTQRCSKDGLRVEKTAFITTEEISAIMWKNGFAENERNALQFTFPTDYKFHYPELAVLFNVSEEDAYKFCMRIRMEASHIGEIDANAVKRGGLLRDHWLLYASGWFLFKNYPFFNYMFFCKAFGFGLWFVSVWALFGRYANSLWVRNELMAQQKNAQKIMDGQDAILSAMKRFANDGDCVGHVENFKKVQSSDFSKYSEALRDKLRDDLDLVVESQLKSIYRFEKNAANELNSLIVSNIATGFKANVGSMDNLAIEYGLSAMKKDGKTNDPIMSYFTKSFSEIQSVKNWDNVKPNESGSIVERIKYSLMKNEDDFNNLFTVSPTEVEQVKQIATKAKVSDGNFDFSKLSGPDSVKIDELFDKINSRVGLVVPHEKHLDYVHKSESSAYDNDTNQSVNQYASFVNTKIDAIKVAMRNDRLSSFVRGMA